MAQRLRIEHRGDIVGVAENTRVFLEDILEPGGPSPAPPLRELEITDAVTELRIRPMQPGELSLAAVTILARSIDLDAELDALFVDVRDGDVWRVTGDFRLERVGDR